MKNEEIDLNEYYDEYNEYAFFHKSSQLFHIMADDFIRTFSKIDKSDKKKRFESFFEYQIKSIDKPWFHMNIFLLNLGIALELALKGIAVHKKFNLFKDKEILIKYDEINVRQQKTCSLRFLIENLNILLGTKKAKNYSDTFLYFKKNRNAFVHYAETSIVFNTDELINYVQKLDKFFRMEIDIFTKGLTPIKTANDFNPEFQKDFAELDMHSFTISSPSHNA